MRSIVVEQGDHDEAYLQELAWHEVAGKRLGRTMAFVENSETRTSVLIMAVVKEPMRLLTRAFLRCAKVVQNPCAWPKLLDFTSPGHSPVWMALQYLAHLVSGPGRRVRLLIGGCQCKDLQTFLREYRPVALKLLRSTTCAASWVHCRQVAVLDSCPWTMSRLADSRLDERQRLRIATNICARPCCADEFFTRRCIADVQAPLELLSTRWRGFLLAWARSVKLSMAGIEFVHAKNRAFATGRMTWLTFAAFFTNSEVQRISLANKKLQSLLSSCIAGSVPGQLYDMICYSIILLHYMKLYFIT